MSAVHGASTGGVDMMGAGPNMVAKDGLDYLLAEHPSIDRLTAVGRSKGKRKFKEDDVGFDIKDGAQHEIHCYLFLGGGLYRLAGERKVLDQTAALQLFVRA
jgi:hypothetical protein